MQKHVGLLVVCFVMQDPSTADESISPETVTDSDNMLIKFGQSPCRYRQNLINGYSCISIILQ